MPPGPDTPSAVEFIATEPAVHRTELVALNVEYMQWVLGGIEQAFGTPPQEVLGQPIADYVAGKIESVCGAPPPQGVFYLVRLHGELAGVLAVCEGAARMGKAQTHERPGSFEPGRQVSVVAGAGSGLYRTHSLH